MSEQTQCGKFISFEGIDGAGKSTHIAWVADWIRSRGIELVSSREPGGTPLGEKLRELLLHEKMHLETEALLMFASRREHIAQVIAPALARCDWVISDRFTDASFAYQGGGRGLDLAKMEALEHWVHPQLQPDLTFLFDVPLDVARARLDATRSLDKFEQEQADFFAATRNEYLRRAAQFPGRFRIIDSTRSIETIRAELAAILEPMLAQPQGPRVMGGAIYPWQQQAWQQLQQLRTRMPHAILFHGAAGTGKADFIEHFAQGLLCEAVLPDGRACGTCVSCGWFSQHNHPDYRRVRPEALEDEAPADDEAGDGDTKKSAKASKAPSKDIKIEQIRALADFMNISTHRQGLRVVVLYPAEALNMPASNALLKTLEEPPPGTVFLLASNSLDRLLPTILSRCRKFALPMPEHAEALAWLKTQGLPDGDADSWLREQGGAPLAALAQAETGNRDDMETLLQLLAHPSVEGALKTADKLQKVSLAAQVSWLQRWLYDVFSYKLAGNVRYYPRYQKELAALAGKIHVSRLLAAIKGANERRATADHPLSPKLFIEDMLLDYTACCA